MASASPDQPQTPDDLWRDFPRTATEFEARFASEEDCRAYWFKARWTISLLKRWLLGTHAGAVSDKHLQAYLDEFAFRHNRRKTHGIARIAARVIEQLVVRAPLTMKALVRDTVRSRWFASKPLAENLS